MKNLFLLIIIGSNLVLAQLEVIQRFPLQDSTKFVNHSLILNAPNGDLLFFFMENDTIYYAKSLDKGLTWSKKLFFAKSAVRSYDPRWSYFSGIVSKSGRIIFTYRKPDSYYKILFSDDNGFTWSSTTENVKTDIIHNPTFTQVDDSTLWFFYTISSSLYYSYSNNNGETWLGKRHLWNWNAGSSCVSISDQHKIIISYDYNLKKIIKNVSFDGGNTWSDSTTILPNTYNNSFEGVSLNLIEQKDSSLVLTFYRKYNFDKTELSEILLSKSFDKGETWSKPERITNFLGRNFNPRTTLVDDDIYISFSSDRYESIQSWYGIVGKSVDLDSPPNIIQLTTVPLLPSVNNNVTILAKVIDSKSTKSVFLNYRFNNQSYTTLKMFDDGMHNDKKANDSTYAITVPYQQGAISLTYFVNAINNDDLSVSSKPRSFLYSNIFTSYYFDINNIKLPINNEGVIADVKINNTYWGRFEEGGFLFSSGFSLSGYSNGKIWSNGVMTASRTEDYLPGTVNNTLDSSYYKIYVLNNDAPAFNNSWNIWKHAVELGAKFYDGDGDGIYNPIDLNGNGEWDANEDKPDIIGDVTAWCVLNDGKPSNDRNFSNVSPQGIEVQQTVFAYSPKTHPKLSNVIFLRYNIENKGTVTDKLDSVYFGLFLDPDLGEYKDDLVGCDSTINSAYVYNNGSDPEYGINPPVFLTTLLQGPVAFVPNETFIDNNNNGLFEEGIDTPIDTGKVLSGQLLGEAYFPGAKNQKMSSFVHYIASHPTQGDPDDELQLRCYMKGINQACISINPCEWVFGEVLNMNCENVNPKFMYSGDPVTRNGWLNRVPDDQRMLLNTGPFDLEKNNPLEIIVAYVIGRGTDALNSITITKEIAKDAIGFYNTNFSHIPVGVEETKTETIPTEFVLEQNYPNPFNPTTTIKYTIPSSVITNPKRGEISLSSKISPSGRNDITNVRLTIYDILGREVTTLVNKQQKPGNYKVTFDASNISSGVYFYKLRTGYYSKTKKMILMR